LVHASAATAKTALRLALRDQRKVLKSKAPDAAERAAALAPAALEAFGVVAGYRPQGAEFDPGPLMRRLAQVGARLVLPRASHIDAPLDFHAFQDGDAFELDAYRIPAPPAASPILIPNLVIVPLLAFDAQGGRMGQGAGCYDRTLEALRAAGPVFVLGLAYAGQEVAEIPSEAHDQKLDAILTETGYRAFEQDF